MMTTIENKNLSFRQLLQEELLRRCKANPKYSLRAFAGSLGLESSRLSKILRGERPANAMLVEKLGQKLGLTLNQIEQYKSQTSNTKNKKSTDYHQISLDAFQLIADWHHYAVLELMKTTNFKSDVGWIARRLGATVHEIRACVERLQRIGILEINNKGEWFDKSKGFSTHILGESYTSYAHKQAQEQILNLAVQALRDIPIEIRDQSSMMMATSVKKINEAKKRITKFRRELCEFLEDTSQKDSVYQLGIALYPLDKKNEN